ncbi:lipoprotein [Gordonia phage Ligma]|nr:lipoprotein [Gordonia phage Ligma]UQT02183.1 lipoprotein [Gordonia phage Axumite]
MRKSTKTIAFAAGACAVVGIGMAAVGEDTAAPAPAAATSAPTVEAVLGTPTPVAPATVEITTTTPSTPAVSAGQSNALSKARNYIEIMPFSYSGLVEQLEFDGFTADEADYAVSYLQENGEVDWTEQAVTKAKSYLEIMPMSRSELIAQLEFDGWSNADATAGADGAGL